MACAVRFASLLIAVGADVTDEATALLQSGIKTKGLDDDDTGSCAGKEELCFDATSMSGVCLRKQTLWDFPMGYWNCQRAAKFCGHSLWKHDVVRCCPGVCTAEELYRAEAPVFNGGGIGGCQASNETCADCAGTSNLCLHSRKGWNSHYTCETSKKWCTDKKWGKDLRECCPGVCNTEADDNGVCQLKGCSESTGTCTDCNDYSDMCLRWLWKSKKHTCESARLKGYCNHRKFGPDMLTCCPGMCEAEIDNSDSIDVTLRGRCGRVGCHKSEDTCTDCAQNSDKCIAKRRGGKQTCLKARMKGMCTRNYGKKNGRTWMQDMLECCPRECGAVPNTVDGQQVCEYSGCQASDQHCADCNDYSDRCMQEYKNSHKWTCEKARDAGYCSTRGGVNWQKRREAMNNCCPGVCKGDHNETEMIPEWAICRGGSGKDDEAGIESSDVTPAEPPAASMD